MVDYRLGSNICKKYRGNINEEDFLSLLIFLFSPNVALPGGIKLRLQFRRAFYFTSHILAIRRARRLAALIYRRWSLRVRLDRVMRV